MMPGSIGILLQHHQTQKFQRLLLDNRYHVQTIFKVFTKVRKYVQIRANTHKYAQIRAFLDFCTFVVKKMDLWS